MWRKGEGTKLNQLARMNSQVSPSLDQVAFLTIQLLFASALDVNITSVNNSFVHENQKGAVHK